jgi:hypothetical protein
VGGRAREETGDEQKENGRKKHYQKGVPQDGEVRYELCNVITSMRMILTLHVFSNGADILREKSRELAKLIGKATNSERREKRKTKK